MNLKTTNFKRNSAGRIWIYECSEQLRLRTLTLIEQFIYGSRCVELLYLTTSGHYLKF